MENISIIAQFKKKKSTDTLGAIIIRGFYNRRPVTSKTIHSGISWLHWDTENRCMLPGTPNANLINQTISIRLQEMKAQLMKLDIAGGTVNRNAVFKAVKGIDDKKDFLAFCRQRIKADYTSKETIRSYECECSKLEKFKPVISFADVDFLFLTSYRNYMRDELANDGNTIWKSLKFINTMINKAMAIGGIIEESPFQNFDRGKYIQKPRTYLEIEDLEKMERLTNDDDQPVIVRRVAVYFLLMSYSGMRFNEAMLFNPDEHVIGDRLVMKYQKWNTDIDNKIHQRLQRIIDIIRTQKLKLSNQKFNQWLKLAAAAAGIKKDISSHVGRHTFGGILAELEIPKETAQVLLGHRDMKSTNIYYHQKQKTKDAAMDRINTIK